MCLPGEIRTPSAAFGGLRPIRPAGRSSRRCTRGRIRTCGETVNSRPRCQLRHPGKRADVPARATPWGITGPTHAVSSTARESNPARRFGRPGPSRSDSGTHRAKWSSAPDLHRHVTRLQLAAYLFRSSGANVERGGDGANRTRATIVGHGLADRPVTTPARLRTHERIRTPRACVRSAGRDPIAVGVATAAGFEPASPG